MAVDQDAVDLFQPQIDALVARVDALEKAAPNSALNEAVEQWQARFWTKFDQMPDDAAKVAYLQNLGAV